MTSLQKARIAVSVIFFVNGAGFASWVPHIPLIRQRFDLSEGELGLTLLVIAIGAILAMPLAGGLIEKVGSKRVVSVVTVGFCLLLSVLLLMPNYLTLCVLLFMFGMVNGSMDVAMNAHGVLVEQKYQKPIMSSFHGLFSTGGLVGAGLASAFLAMGFTPAQHMLILLSTLFIVAIVALNFLLPAERAKGIQSKKKGPLLVFPSQSLVWYLALLGFLVLMVEGAMADWTAIHIMELPQATASLAAFGFAGFSLTMAIGRLLGDNIIRAVSRARVLRYGSAIAAVGLLIVVVIHQVWGAVIGFGLVGIGLSNVVPIIFSSAGYANPDAPGRGIAAVTTMGYFGFLIGPPLIGFIAEGVSLNGAWLMLTAFLGGIMVMAPRLIHRLPQQI